jgi:hypothetical protein
MEKQPESNHQHAPAQLASEGQGHESGISLAPPAFSLKASPVQKKAAPASSVIQRHAFIKESQVAVDDQMNEGMKTMATDDKVRNYESRQEFQDHSEGKTDYLGNLTTTSEAGTWMRFKPTGMNILGEMHTYVQLGDIMPRVGSKNFINEQFSSDNMSQSPNMKSAYEEVNAKEFKRFGVEGEADKQQFGSESLYPKMGYGMNLALPYLAKTEPLDKIKSGPDNYDGKPIQRYLTIAWGYSKDNAAKVEAQQKAKQTVGTKAAELCRVHRAVEGVVDPFVAGLVPDGFLGDPLAKKENAKMFRPLHDFAFAITEAMVEMATTEKSSRLSDEKRKKLANAQSTSLEDKQKLFSDWRNFNFEDNVTAAAAKGVRYAGMGNAHLDYLRENNKMPANSTGYDMITDDIDKMIALTKKLRGKVSKTTK